MVSEKGQCCCLTLTSKASCVTDPHSQQSQEEVLALNAAAIIANIKLQRQLSQRKKSSEESLASLHGDPGTVSPLRSTYEDRVYCDVVDCLYKSVLTRVQNTTRFFFSVSEVKEERNTKLYSEQNEVDHNKQPLAQERSDETISLQVRSFSELIKKEEKKKEKWRFSFPRQ